MKVIVVFGTRPEAIKLAPVVRELKQSGNMEVIACSTGQHREMLSQVTAAFDIRPDISLNLMEERQSLNYLSSRVLSTLEDILKAERPDWVLVQGDTATAFAAALASFHRNVRVGHVEAGLRSFDRAQPYPEEVNRCLIAVLANLHFAPTPQARLNLLNEAVPPHKIVITGNTVIDALHWALRRPLHALSEGGGSDIISTARQARASGRRLILVTAHRRENLGQPLQQICEAIRQVALSHSESAHFFFPMHLNPEVTDAVTRRLRGISNITLSPPLDYLTLLHLLQLCYLAVTDSGGLQEEAPALGVPVLLLRETTERPEGVRSGLVKLVGANRDRINSGITRLLNDEDAHKAMIQANNPYGDGLAAHRIAAVIANFEENRSFAQWEWKPSSNCLIEDSAPVGFAASARARDSRPSASKK